MGEVLKVLEWNPRDDYHLCQTEDEGEIKIDLMVGGTFDELTKPEDLVGKTVSIERKHGYIWIGHGAKIEATGDQA